MDIYETRRLNIRDLITRRYNGKIAAFADAVERAPSYVSRCVSGKPEHRKRVGEDLARAIEEKIGLERYWLDQASAVDVDGLPVKLVEKIKSYRPIVEIERYDIAASMGPGTEPPEINMVVESMRLDANWVRQNLTYTNLDNLKLISGRGDSMAPTIRSGDAVIVDAGVTSVESDAIYFFLMRGQMQIKRIQRGLDGLRIISDNAQYPPIDIPGDREGDITVLAQIIYWWTGRSF